ncbi:hypothetical protein MMC27_008894 [Xylographa pallens]|nr:hypothetical protein [Xylographa pallens]
MHSDVLACVVLPSSTSPSAVSTRLKKKSHPDMVLFGLGILFASIAFLLLRDPRPRWRKFVQNWTLKKGGVVGKVLAAQSDEDEQVDRGATQLKGPQNISHLSTPDDFQSEKPRQVTSSLASDSPSQITEEGVTVENAQAPTTTFVLLDDEVSDMQNESFEFTPRRRSQCSSSSASASMDQSSPVSQKHPPTPIAVNTAAALNTIPKLPQISARQLMPPPSARPSALRPLPKLGNSLNPPPSLASTLRGPPSRSSTPGSTSSLAATASTLAPSARPSRKVILPPGHSPLDWAQLTSHPPTSTFLRGAGVPPQLIRVTPSQLRENNGRNGRDAWSTWQGKVYNITPYRKFHPGGEGELMRGAGKPGVAEKLFMEIHPWVNWEGMLGECMVGILVGENEDTEKEADLESMD